MAQHNKTILDMSVTANDRLGQLYSLLKLRPVNGTLPAIEPGQFVQVEIMDSKTTYLRRPISVNNVVDNELWLLVRKAGDGTRHLAESKTGDIINVVLPLGYGFTIPSSPRKMLLVGGGVGVAPLLYFGRILSQKGIHPTFLLGARSASDLLMIDEFKSVGDVCLSTEDGSAGENGLVTTNSILSEKFDTIACCGPMPMMKAVAAIARENNIDCEVSLENMMACGLGACLCCVEKDSAGHNVCVCTEGPVFNIKKLSW